MKPYLLLLLLLLPLTAYTAPTASKIIVYKHLRKMELLDSKGHVIRSYHIALGGNPKGHKTQEGDHKTPEGPYVISGRNPNSYYHRSLYISYPNEQDKAQARRRGVSPGGGIMIHGLHNGHGLFSKIHRFYDWTKGCIAVTNKEIEEIWTLVPDGTAIEILP